MFIPLEQILELYKKDGFLNPFDNLNINELGKALDVIGALRKKTKDMVFVP